MNISAGWTKRSVRGNAVAAAAAELVVMPLRGMIFITGVLW